MNFNPILVLFKHSTKPVYIVYTGFQSYISLIQADVKNEVRQIAKKFQSYISLIQATFQIQWRECYLYFNPILVLFKPDCTFSNNASNNGFQSYISLIQAEDYVYATLKDNKFQSYISLIQAFGICYHMFQVYQISILY